MKERTAEGVLMELCEIGEVKPRCYTVCEGNQKIRDGIEKNMYCMRRNPECTTYGVEVEAKEFRRFIQKAVEQGSASMIQEFHEDLEREEKGEDMSPSWDNWVRWKRFHGYAEIKLRIDDGLPKLEVRSLGKAKWTGWE